MFQFRFTDVCSLLVIGLCITRQAECLLAETPKADDVVGRQMALVELHSTATVPVRIIRLADIADVTGTDAAVRDRLKQLDIEDPLEPGETTTISRQQVGFRLRLAGLDVDRISIRGQTVSVKASRIVDPVAAVRESSKTATTKPRRTVDFISDAPEAGTVEQEIVRASRECILSKLPWKEEDVSIRLAQSLPTDIRKVETSEDYQFTAELRSQGPAVGRVQVRVVGRSSQRPPIDVTFTLEVRHFDNVVLAKRTIERGHMITADDLYIDRQDVTDLTDYCSTTKELVGCTVKRAVRALLPVKQNDVDQASSSNGTLVVKRREQVRLTARLGAINVSVTGEAQQDGRLGEIIQVKNLDSNSNVKGKVVGPGEVEISF